MSRITAYVSEPATLAQALSELIHSYCDSQSGVTCNNVSPSSSSAMLYVTLPDGTVGNITIIRTPVSVIVLTTDIPDALYDAVRDEMLSTRYRPCIPLSSVYNAVSELVDAYSDFVYDSGADVTCKYTVGGDKRYPGLCGCIIGQALLLATPRQAVNAMQAYLAELDNGSTIGVWSLLRMLANPAGMAPVRLIADKELSDDKIEEMLSHLSYVQKNQDQHRTWFDAWQNQMNVENSLYQASKLRKLLQQSTAAN
jgi:hypothetical protein